MSLSLNPTFSSRAIDCTHQVPELLQAAMSEPIGIDKLARKVGMNARTLHDCFKHLYGKTIFEYSQHQRLEHGKTLLMNHRQSIQAIAEECGYSEQSNFSVAFKKKYGVGPGEWRKGQL